MSINKMADVEEILMDMSFSAREKQHILTSRQ